MRNGTIAKKIESKLSGEQIQSFSSAVAVVGATVVILDAITEGQTDVEVAADGSRVRLDSTECCSVVDQRSSTTSPLEGLMRSVDSIERLRRNTVHMSLTMQPLRKAMGVQRALVGVGVDELARVVQRLLVQVTALVDSIQTIGGKSQESSLVRMVVGNTVVLNMRRFNLLALELALDTLAVGGVANERQDRTDVLDQDCTLVGLSIVEGSLNTVVAE